MRVCVGFYLISIELHLIKKYSKKAVGGLRVSKSSWRNRGPSNASCTVESATPIVRRTPIIFMFAVRFSFSFWYLLLLMFVSCL